MSSPTAADLYSINVGSNTVIVGGIPTTVMVRGGGWNLVPFTYDKGQLTAVATPDQQTILAVGLHRVVGGAGVFIATFDGGSTWTIDTTVGVDLFDIVCPSGQVCYRSGEAGLVEISNDGGRTWTDVSINTGQDVYALYFVDDLTGWAVGTVDTTAVIFYTADGGLTWTRQNSGLLTPLFDIFCVDNQTCWAVGSAGEIISTVDGGNTWTVQTSGVTVNLNSVYFIDANTGWIVGAGGTILNSTDGGATWTQESSPVTTELFEVFMINATSGWAVGGSGTILYYGVDTPTGTQLITNVAEDIVLIRNGENLIVFMPDDLTSANVEIYSTDGRLVASSECTGSVCGISLPEGTYDLLFVAISKEGSVLYRKPMLILKDGH